jgi:hypothetical protein
MRASRTYRSMRYEGLSKPFTLGVFAAACVFAALATGAPPSARSQSAPSATVTPAESPSSTPSLTATPSPSISPPTTPSPTPSPVATPTILMLPPEAAPQILWYSISTTTPHVGDSVFGIVLCSSNVASVELRVGSFLGINLAKVDVGHFEGTYVVPKIPFFVSRKFTMQIIARNTAGIATEDDFPMQVR